MHSRLLSTIAVVMAFAAVGVAADDHPVVAAAKKGLHHPDQPFAMWVTVTTKAGKEKELEQAFLTCQKSTLMEKGCLAYDINRGGDRKYHFYEKWKDVDGLAAHVDAAHTQKLLAQLGDLTEGEPTILFLPAVLK